MFCGYPRIPGSAVCSVESEIQGSTGCSVENQRPKAPLGVLWRTKVQGSTGWSVEIQGFIVFCGDSRFHCVLWRTKDLMAVLWSSTTWGTKDPRFHWVFKVSLDVLLRIKVQEVFSRSAKLFYQCEWMRRLGLAFARL